MAPGSNVEGKYKINFDASTGHMVLVGLHEVSQNLLGQLIEIEGTVYEVLRNYDGSVTLSDIVYASKRYKSNAELEKVNIEL